MENQAPPPRPSRQAKTKAMEAIKEFNRRQEAVKEASEAERKQLYDEFGLVETDEDDSDFGTEESDQDEDEDEDDDDEDDDDDDGDF